MEQTEDTNFVKDILQSITKARKTLRMYPPNNPMYIKTLEETYNKFKEFFEYKEDLSFRIGQDSIYFDSEEIYHKAEKEDNLALFFFKDGLRELTFKKGLSQEELEGFLKIITMDFEKEAEDEDVVTLLWQRDFQNINYIVDDTVLLDVEGEDYELKAVNEAKQAVSDIEGLLKAYDEEFKEEDVKEVPIISFTDKDLTSLMKELEDDAESKIDKLSDILFEILYRAEELGGILEDIFRFLKDTIKFSISYGDFKAVIQLINRAKGFIEDPYSTDEIKKYMKLLLIYPSSDEIINLFGEVLDRPIKIDDNDIKEFIKLLDKRAITPLINVLGELKTFRVREKVVEALIYLGKQDIKTLAMNINDLRWYVVRSIISIIRKIGDKRANEYLLKSIKHGDIRVRKEVIKGISELGGEESLPQLKERLDDVDAGVRIEAVRAIGNIGSIKAKNIILEKISDKSFKERDFEEKKEFFRVLSRWNNDPEIFDFLTKTLKKGSFLWWSKNYEEKACAVLCLGLIGNKEALPLLYKHKDSGNKLLDELTQTAIRRIERGS
ncbi:MAG: HEAT repeat domain-containing protein [Nitrospirae bacterium]|nr:HEAT repeat domain-containing protein [Nitrospirota bacterium]